MKIDTSYFDRCIATLAKAIELIKQTDQQQIEYDLYRSAAIKEFEIVLELSAKLLKKRLQPFFASRRQLDSLTFKDIFRHAVKHNIIEPNVADRWFEYRNNRNITAHDYGKGFAENTLVLLPLFVSDAVELSISLKKI